MKPTEETCSLPGCDNPVHAKALCHRHYRQQLRATKPKKNLCQCGCGQPTAKHFVNGHNTRVLPPEEQARRGTFSGESRRGTGVGYVKLHQRHEHRRVAEQAAGRTLDYSEVVHHIDGDPKNNTPANLVVLSRAAHIAMHRQEMMAARKAKRGY